MPLYKPTELRAFLDSLGASPKKSLSQNFLIDGNIIRNIVKAADIKSGDQVLEIGPGPGSLTEELLNQGAKVVVVETDRLLAKALERFPIEIVVGDALKTPLERLFAHFESTQPIKLLGNLPYHITTPLLTRFLPIGEKIALIVVMVQDEVARRMAANPQTAEYGSLTLFLQYYSKISYAFKVSRNCFYPSPKVDSAVVRLDLKSPPNIDPALFFQLTRRAFQQRRKTLRQSLKELYPQEALLQAIEIMTLSPTARPEELSLAQFIELFQHLQNRIAR